MIRNTIKELEQELSKSPSKNAGALNLLEELERNISQEAIIWSVEDFTEYPDISESNARLALADMIRNHDANFGITWDTVREYYLKYKNYEKTN